MATRVDDDVEAAGLPAAHRCLRDSVADAESWYKYLALAALHGKNNGRQHRRDGASSFGKGGGKLANSEMPMVARTYNISGG